MATWQLLPYPGAGDRCSELRPERRQVVWPWKRCLSQIESGCSCQVIPALLGHSFAVRDRVCLKNTDRSITRLIFRKERSLVYARWCKVEARAGVLAYSVRKCCFLKIIYIKNELHKTRTLCPDLILFSTEFSERFFFAKLKIHTL